MKNRNRLLFLFLAVLAMLTIGIIGTAACEPAEKAVLPSYLRKIETEAFEGTAILSVVFPESLEEIGERAFADNELLFSARFLGERTIVSDNAFDGALYLKLSGFQGSYIHQWAKNNNRRFILLEQIRQKKEAGIVACISEKDDKNSRILSAGRLSFFSAEAETKERSSGRTVGELKASYYSGIKSVYIQSRYFP